MGWAAAVGAGAGADDAAVLDPGLAAGAAASGCGVPSPYELERGLDQRLYCLRDKQAIDASIVRVMTSLHVAFALKLIDDLAER